MCGFTQRLEEDEATGAKSYRYLRTGPDHFSLAFTYESIAAQEEWQGRVTGVVI